MTTNPSERAGWELIWQVNGEHPRYGTTIAPNASVVEWADSLPAGGFVLDVGCGVGRHVVYLGGRGFRMAGVDISPTGIQKTQEACAERQIEFEGYVSNINTLKWPDATFDAALSTSTIHHFLRAGIEQTLREIRRVLKPGGLLLVDFLSTGTAGYEEMRQQAAAGEVTEVEPNTFIDERATIDAMSDSFLPHHFCDEADLRDLLRNFEIVELRAALQGGKDSSRAKWVAFVRKPF
jgi:tellurite methyltransferase